MDKVHLLLIFYMLISNTSCGQVKNAHGDKEAGLISGKLLLGKWRSKDDSEVILMFGKDKYVELYNKDTTDNLNYKLSSSCVLKDSSSQLNLKNAYLLFYLNDGTVNQCDEVLNLTSNILSWMNNENGKIFVFKKII
jgi:hypothetical protein